MTPKQADYRKILIERNIDDLVNSTSVSPESLFNALVAVNLPEPTTTADTSAQIDALKSTTAAKQLVRQSPELMAKCSAMNPELVKRIREAKNFLPMDEVEEYLRNGGKKSLVISILRGEG